VIDLKNHAAKTFQEIDFVAGDLGSVRSSKALLNQLAERAKKGRFDYLVVTAAVFPDWENLLQEDGLEKGHAIAIVGRYLVYRHMNLFMKERPRVLNVLASGGSWCNFDRALFLGERNVTGLMEAILNWGGGFEIMQIGLKVQNKDYDATRVTTNPGFISTELHTGQGWVQDHLEPILAATIGISEEEAGVRQASILASPALYKDKITYVDDDMIGRLPSPALETCFKEHGDWLMSWLGGVDKLDKADVEVLYTIKEKEKEK